MNRYQPLFESSISIGYHITPAYRLSSIKEKGLLVKKTERGVYFWDNREIALWFADTYSKGEDDAPRDNVLLTVNLKGLELIPDSETEDMEYWGYRGEGKGFIYKGNIDTGRILDEEKI